MQIRTMLLLAVATGVIVTMEPLLTVPPVHAANTPPVTKESKPAGNTMSGTEQKGNNTGRNANTKPTAPPKK
jgi:hypothetical protein